MQLTFCGKCGKMGLSWGMGARAWYGVVGTFVGRLTPPSRMGKKGKGKGKRETQRLALIKKEWGEPGTCDR